MKQVCLQCERSSSGGNLYCQETYCPAEMSPTILGYGEWFGDIEIIKPVIVLRSSVLYEAMHQQQKVFLKVAHPGTDNKERLKREAEFLSGEQSRKKPSPYLPSILPPYAFTSLDEDAYGKMMLGGHLLYFYLFEFVEGEPLRDVLLKNPQLWINHVGWIMISLASAVNHLHLQDLYHYGICPDGVLVNFDKDPPSVPRVLLYDFGIASQKHALSADWYSYFILPSYTAPELMGQYGYGVRPDYRTDVYGLGLTFYEMLVGEPTFSYKLRGDEEVYEAVKNSDRIKMNRMEDVGNIASITLQAVNPSIQRRQPTAADLAEELIRYFGQVPEPKKRRWPSLNTIMWVVISLLAIVFLITLALSLTTS